MNDLNEESSNDQDYIIISLAEQLITADYENFKQQMNSLSEKQLIDMLTEDGATKKQISEIVEKRRMLIAKSRRV